MRIRLVTLFALVLAASAYIVVTATRPAEAVPASQSKCAFNEITTNSTTAPKVIGGMGVSVNAGASAKRVIVQFSGDTGVDAGAEVRISYSIDGGAVQEDTFGPANLANHQEFREARAVIAVIPIPAGTHTIRPFWRVSGVAGKNAAMDSRCFTAEAATG